MKSSRILREIFNVQMLPSVVLNEQAGANIRNKVAHGMIEAEACSSGACLYFGAALIKLLTYTSIPCYQLLKSSEKLKCLKRPVEA